MKINFWDGIERVCKLNEKGRIVLAADDDIIIKEAAELQIKRMFSQFGLDKMPETFIELVANWNYCQRIDKAVTKLINLDDDAREKYISSLECAGIKDELKIIHDGKAQNKPYRDELTKLNNEKKTFEQNCSVSVYTLDLNILG